MENSVTLKSTVMSGLYLPFVALSNYLDFNWELFAPLAMLLFLDYLTGWIKVWIVDPENLKSHRAIAGIITKAVVLVIPVAFLIAGKQIEMLTTVGYSIIAMLVLAELYSIIGNIRSIVERKEVPEVDALRFVLRKIASIIEKFLKRG